MSIAALIIDPAQLQLQLEKAGEAREEVDAVVDWLEQGVALVEGTPTPERAPEPPAGAFPVEVGTATQAMGPARAGARDRDGKILSALLKANGPRRLVELADHAGLTEQQARASVKRLIAAGKAVQDGRGRATRYRRVEQVGFHTERREKVERGLRATASREAAGARRVIVRDRVMKAVAANPGTLNEKAIAAQTGLPETEVNQACAWLVEHAALDYDPGTDTFRRHGQAAV